MHCILNTFAKKKVVEMTNFKELFSQFKHIKVGVVGDVMLDTYWWGNVNRISPEAPVPIVALQKQELRLGGAANVCLNLVSLGAITTAISVIGEDENADKLLQEFDKNNINFSLIVKDKTRPTTNKTRIISRNQQMMRLDAETTTYINENVETQLLQNIKNYIEQHQPQVIILQDYNKGVLTPKVIKTTIDWCNENNIITTVDPKKKNFFEYKNVTIFKPNVAEVKEGLNVLLEEINERSLLQIHQQLQASLQHQISLITLSEKGVYYNNGLTNTLIPTHIRSIADVSGAGDTVISVASLLYAATKNIHLAAEVANIAGGLVCETVGTVAINKQKLLVECEQLLSS